MSELRIKKKPINFTSKEIQDVERLIDYKNSIKGKEERKDTFSSIVRNRAITQIRKELKQIEKGS